MLFCVGILCRSRRDTCESRAGIPRLSDCPDTGAVVPWFERRSLSSLREIGDFPLAVRTLRVLTTSRKSEIFERPRLGVQTWRPIDILLGLKGEDSHARTVPRWVGSFRFVEGPGPCRGFTPSRSGLHWPCQVAVTPLLETTGPVVSSGLAPFVGGFGGTCVATGTDVSRRGTVGLRSDASEFVRLSRHGRGRAASDT